jgi:3-phosphoshikimate 1-carboxyvinyltransferase
MSSLRVKAISSLHAEFSVPGDKSVSHRAAILGGLSNGVCEISNFLPSEDCLNTLKAMRSLGARFDVIEQTHGCAVLLLLHCSSAIVVLDPRMIPSQSRHC